MRVHRRLLLIASLVCLLLGGAPPPHAHAATGDAPASAFVEPALLEAGGATRSVIVVGTRAGRAAAAVDRVGGQVTSDLWLIDAVSATVPAHRIRDLSRQPGVRSIVADQGVTPSDSGGSGGQNRPGWVTERRERKGSFDLAGTMLARVASLSDGRTVSVTENGHVLVVTPDGLVQTRVALQVNGFTTAPVIGADNTIYLARKDRQVYALTPEGAVRWVYTGADSYSAGVARAADGTIYAVNEKRVLVALNPANGQPRWQLRLGPDSAGAAATTPVVGPDGTIYVTTSANPGSIFAVSPTGSLRWTGVSRKDVPFSYPPIVGPAQTLYLPSVERVVYVVNSANGALRGVLSTQGKIVAPPALASDGSLYVTAEERSLYAFGPDGRLRFEFRPPAGKFTTSPAPTPDGQLVYAAVEEGVLYAVNAATGTQQWSAATVGAIKVNPTVDARGNVFLGSDGKELLVLTPAGTATTRLRLDDRVTQPVSVGPTGNLVVRIGDKRLVMAGYLRDRWNGSRDVEPTELKREWALSNPVAIDVSADIVHERGFTGQGVTIAVVDSGVYFTSKIDDILGAELERQFVGQADFVGNGLCRGDGVQYPQATTGPATPAYCFTDHKKSIDAYGHGSHVAGIIWSQITDHATGVAMGVAKNANILSVRVLDENGQGSYTDVIEGIQYVVQNKDQLRIRVLNLSLSAQPSVPYFVDPLNRAVERAWASGIVVVAAAGNSGPGAETITVPGNDPYVITVGAINSNRTPGYWADDFVPEWSATGPTGDGFVKPDVLAPGSNIISFIYTNKDDARSANLARMHPDYVVRDSSSLFRMSGTSMSTAVASGVVALMLEANPSLTPDQVKYRLMETARPAVADGGVLVYSPLQQGAGRIWASDAVLGTFPADGRANQGMDILADLAHGYESDADLAFHYQGPIRRTLSDDGQAYLYHTAPESGDVIGLGVSRADTRAWIDQATLASGRMTWSVGRMTWSVGLNWEGGLSMASGRMTWSVGRMTWSVGRMTWSVGRMTWSVNQTWSTGGSSSATAREAWAQSANPERSIVSSTLWVHDD